PVPAQLIAGAVQGRGRKGKALPSSQSLHPVRFPAILSPIRAPRAFRLSRRIQAPEIGIDSASRELEEGPSMPRQTQLRASDIMTSEMITLNANASIQEAAAVLIDP